MERLTYEIIDGGIVVDKEEIKEFEIEDGITVYGGNAILRLAEYEYTDLTPGQIREIDKLYAEKCRELDELKKKVFQMPCEIGDTIYVIEECGMIPRELDGTLYDLDGPGTATGYYCPYEDECPHDSDDFTNCNDYASKSAVFEDSVKSIWIDEDGIHIAAENTTVCGDIGEVVFLTREEAEAKLAEMEGGHE